MPCNCKIIRGFIAAIEREWILTCICLILGAMWMVLSFFSYYSCYQVPCICKIFLENIAAIGRGLETYMHLPYFHSSLDGFIFLKFVYMIICAMYMSDYPRKYCH